MHQDNYVQRAALCGIVVSVYEDGGTFATFFSNTPGTFEELHQVRALRQQPRPWWRFRRVSTS